MDTKPSYCIVNVDNNVCCDFKTKITLPATMKHWSTISDWPITADHMGEKTFTK